MFRFFLAYKYALRLITLVALLVVVYCVTVLIVIVSVMEGFRSELEARIRGSTSDIKITSTDFIGIENPDRVERILSGIAGIKSTTAVVETLALFRADAWGPSSEAEDRALIAMDLENPVAVEELNSYLEAVDQPPDVPSTESAWTNTEKFRKQPRDAEKIFSPQWLEQGVWEDGGGAGGKKTWRFSSPERDPQKSYLPAIVGLEAVRQDWLGHGSLFRLTSFSPHPPHPPRDQEFFVAGFFKTGLYELDSRAIIIRLKDADEFLQLRGDDGVRQVSGIRVQVEEEYTGEEQLITLRRAVEKALEEAGVFFVKIETWREARYSLLQAVRVEKVIVSTILGVAILFAGFMIFIILTVQVVDRSRDIGVLQSIGSTPRQIATIYFLIGSSLCVLGTILGTVYGIAIAGSINTLQRWIKLLTGYELFPADVYYIDQIPVRFSTDDFLFIIVPTVAASLIASIVPALRAARRDPVVALRYE